MIGPSPELVRNSFLESLRTSDEMFGAEGRPLHALEKAQSDLDLWFSLANSTYFPVEPSEWMLFGMG